MAVYLFFFWNTSKHIKTIFFATPLARMLTVFIPLRMCMFFFHALACRLIGPCVDCVIPWHCAMHTLRPNPGLSTTRAPSSLSMRPNALSAWPSPILISPCDSLLALSLHESLLSRATHSSPARVLRACLLSLPPLLAQVVRLPLAHFFYNMPSVAHPTPCPVTFFFLFCCCSTPSLKHFFCLEYIIVGEIKHWVMARRKSIKFFKFFLVKDHTLLASNGFLLLQVNLINEYGV